jgi:putative membrane protein
MGHGFFFGGPFGMFIGIFFLLFLAFGVFYIITHLLKGKSNNVFQRDSPLDILKRKYANGEINAEEYEKRKTTLLS